jgi:hypothetical protein
MRYWNNAFSKIECESIINIAKDKGYILKQKVFSSLKEDLYLRVRLL